MFTVISLKIKKFFAIFSYYIPHCPNELFQYSCCAQLQVPFTQLNNWVKLHILILLMDEHGNEYERTSALNIS